MINKLGLLVIIITVLGGCVQQQALVKPTSSGYPEGIFRNASLEEAKGKILDGCIRHGLMVSEAGTNQVVCEKTMAGGDAVLAQMLVGNSYSTTPVRKLRFIMYKLNKDVKVTAQEWFQSQMAFGQVNKQELKSNNQRNDIQNFLFSLGAE